MDTLEAARRWASTWADAWPTKDVDAIVALQAETGDHWASLFRPHRGRSGLRAYLRECFAEESQPARCGSRRHRSTVRWPPWSTGP